MITKIILFLSLLIIIASWNKNDSVIIPDITQENTFSCKIQDELFVPKTHGFYSFDGIIVVTSDEKWVINLSNGKITLLINLLDLDENDVLIIQESDGDFDTYNDTNNTVELRIKGDPERHYYSYFKTGSVSVEKFENEELILKFTELELISVHNSSEKIKLTNGKLNINLNTLNQ